MTIRDLTRHTAGFATGVGNPGVGPLLQVEDPMNRQNTLTEMAEKLGRVPLFVSATRVNCGTARSSPFTSWRDRFILPAGSAKIR